MFSMQCGLVFDSTTIRTTSMTGCSAANMENGFTTHQQLQLNKRKNVKFEEEWCGTRFVIIDEISFLEVDTLMKIDSNLRIFKNKREEMFGKVNIIFCGDQWQLPPVKHGKKALYTSPSAQWSSINSVIFLESNHRFQNDPLWGLILERIRTSTCTEEDMNIINSRLLSNTVKLQNNVNYCYACPQNNQRNVISDSVFESFVAATHSQDENVSPPENTVIILGSLYDSNGNLHSNEYHQFIYKNCGDASVKSGTKLIDPRLCLYDSCPVMLSTNDHLIKAGYANGTLCSFQGYLLRPNADKLIMKYAGYYVNAVKATDIDYLLVKKWDDTVTDNPQQTGLKVSAKKDTVSIKIKHRGIHVPDMKIKILQFPILNAIAITGHKLQGLSKDNLVVVDFDYKTPQWIYVALSRVRTQTGLFLMKKFDMTKLREPDRRLVAEDNRLRSLE